MAFLRVEDYYEFIPEAHFNVILKESRDIDGDPELRERVENKCVSKAKEYLRSRYRVDRIFAPFKAWSLLTTYSWGSRIDFTATDYSAAAVYTSGQLNAYLGNIYEKNATTSMYVAGTLPTNATFFTLRGAQEPYFVPFPDQFDEDAEYAEDDFVTYKHEVYKRNDQVGSYEAGILPTDEAYFDRIKTTDYTTEYPVLGRWPNNTDYWTEGDNRDQTVLEVVVHCVINKIHSIINPRNIPQLRRDNYQGAIEWLKDCQKGTIEADLPIRSELSHTGYTLSFGSNAPTTHGY
jgi:hypothetical protein